MPNIKSNFFYSMGYQILSFLVPLITAPYVARVLGPEGVGMASFTGSVQTYFALFATLGTVAYGTREISRVRTDVLSRSRLFWEIELLTILTTCACLLGWLLLIGFAEKYRIYYLILTMSLVAVIFDISWFFMGMEEFRYIVLRNTVFRLLGMAALFLFVRDAGDTPSYVAISALSALLGNLSMWVYLPRFVRRVPFRSLKVFRHFRETVIYFIPAIATSVYTVLDKTLLGVLVDAAAENGYYEQALKIVRMAQALTFSALNSVMSSRMSFLFAEGRDEEIHQRIKRSMDYILFMGIGIMCGLLGTANTFVPWFFGAGYERVVPFVQALSPLILIIGISNCIGSHYYTPAGFRGMSARFIICGACVNLALNLLLIPMFWGMGAIIATLAAEGIVTVLYFRFCGDYLTIRTVLKTGWKKILSGCGMLCVICILRYIPVAGELSFIIQAIGGVVTYIWVLFILHDSFLEYLLLLAKNRWERVV